MMQVVEELSSLRLDVLDADWVQGIYYSEFLEFGEFPSEYEGVLESLDMRKKFRGIMRAIDQWLCTDEVDEDKSWAALTNHVPHDKLLAILAYFIDHGTKNVVTKELRNNALLASRVYYKLLAIPGYKVYHIYHSQLFAHSLACLGFPKTLCDNEDNYFNVKELTNEVNSLIRELGYFVLDLRDIIETLQLSPDDMNFEDILSNLVDITGGAIVNKLNIDKIELANISGVIYQLIDILLCDSDREPNPVAIRLLFKCVLPKLVAASVDCKNANNLVRASYVTYSGLLLSKYGKAALSGYTVLLQHLCYTPDGLERAEVRQARVSLVMGLMSLLPRKAYRSIVKWVLKLSTTARVSHRQLALEMLSKLLCNEPEEEKPNPPEPVVPNPEPEAMKVENQGTGQSDENQAPNEGQETAPVGDNATEVTEEPPKDGEEPLKEEETKEVEIKVEIPDTPVITINTDDESSQDCQLLGDAEEDEVAGLLRARAHKVPHGEVLRAVYERLNDSASTLRARAFHVLAECVSREHAPYFRALQELNGDGPVSRLMAAAARGVCDERAAVRRAALALVQRSLCTPTSPIPQSDDLAILVGLCRDASIIVRSAAIAALGELTVRRASDAVFDAFFNGPMHQLSDPEAKVQEQVTALIQQILIDRLEKYSPGRAEDPLPWMFLDAATRHNMRRHLQKACLLLAKSASGINVRLVDMSSTHLGALDAARDLHCLVLLTSVARHVDYGDTAFALDYYYRLADDKELRDREPRLMPLTLELLTAWARWARPGPRAALRDHVVARLAAANDDGCRLAAVSLAAHLDPENLVWATELMQLSERRAVTGVDIDEWLRAADLSLVAPEPPSPALLRLFLGALTDPPAEWSEEQRGVCVAGCGRLCVRSREAAAAAAPALAALLRDPAAPMPARHNALLALADICTRYTCIVEPLLGDVCGCLAVETDALLRRAAARAITRLLLAGYLRLRTPLYYRYCALLADEDHAVREPAEYYVTCCLGVDAIFFHFVDCLMHYNSDNSETVSFDARQLIYDVMLQRLSLVQRLNLQCRLARDVLEHAADVTDEGDGELPAALNAALLDTITLLCGPRMKLPRKTPREGEAADIDDLQERVTTNIVSHNMKSMVAEVLVPAVLRLYARLRTRGGQVAAYLVRIANDLLADYRHEIEELIQDDEELVERVRHFQETIGLEPSFGNTRNLVTKSTAHDPETPHAPRRRVRHTRSPKKRALNI